MGKENKRTEGGAGEEEGEVEADLSGTTDETAVAVVKVGSLNPE